MINKKNQVTFAKMGREANGMGYKGLPGFWLVLKMKGLNGSAVKSLHHSIYLSHS
jgi:hypothetical protein